MKRIRFRGFMIILILLPTFFIAAEVSITELNIDHAKNGSDYFPLFVGAGWTWNVKGLGDVSEITWQLVSTHSITDTSNDLNQAAAYKLQFKEFDASWYVLEHDGFICFYDNAGSTPNLDRILPIIPQLGETWSEGNNNYKVTTVEENMIKVELINEIDSRFGYQMFIKDVGPYEIFEYTKAGEEQKDMIMTLIDNISFEDAPEVVPTPLPTKAPVATATPVIEEDSTVEKTPEPTETPVPTMTPTPTAIEAPEPTIDNEPDIIILDDEDATPEPTPTVEEIEEEPVFNFDDSYYLDTLSKRKTFIQVGAFNVLYYAQMRLKEAVDMDYKAYIYYVEGSFYKVVIEVEGNPDRALKKIRRKLAKDAFKILK